MRRPSSSPGNPDIKEWLAAIGRGWRALWVSAPPWRAVAETLLLALAAVGISLLLAPNAAATERAAQIDPTMVMLAGPFCALWCALRMRPLPGAWWRGALLELAIGCLLSVLPFTIVVVTAYVLALENHYPAISWNTSIRGISLSFLALFLFAAFSLEFVVFRLGVRLWLRLNRLRRTRLQWSMTYGLLVAAALSAGALILLAVTLATLAGGGSHESLFRLVPLIFVFSVLSAFGLLIVLPPSAIFSYIFARYMTRRLQTLTEATNALRAGDYAMRVPVVGEDEVAQLQANFNAMAADLERAVRDLQAERDNVATLLRARRELVASVSHELRTPVATLRSYLESARMRWERETDAPPATLHHDLEIMQREAIHLQSLIDDLFTLSRAEVGHLELRPAPTDVSALARRAVEAMAAPAWETNRVQVLFTGSAGTAALPLAMVDGGRIEQALRNLLHNGIRHTPPGGIVAVEVAAEGMDILVRVKDTGEGIAPADLPHIFDRFYRGEGARMGAGSGLGLALVKEMVEAMGGSVAVASQPGAGSCFALRLPAAVKGTVKGAPNRGELPRPLDRATYQLPA